jgi:hypothetical protein
VLRDKSIHDFASIIIFQDDSFHRLKAMEMPKARECAIADSTELP